MELEDIIRAFLIEEFNEDGFNEDIRSDESLIEEDIIDSLGILKIISFLDERFGIASDKDEFEPTEFESIDSITKYIKKKLGRKKVRELIG